MTFQNPKGVLSPLKDPLIHKFVLNPHFIHFSYTLAVFLIHTCVAKGRPGPPLKPTFWVLGNFPGAGPEKQLQRVQVRVQTAHLTAEFQTNNIEGCCRQQGCDATIHPFFLKQCDRGLDVKMIIIYLYIYIERQNVYIFICIVFQRAPSETLLWMVQVGSKRKSRENCTMLRGPDPCFDEPYATGGPPNWAKRIRPSAKKLKGNIEYQGKQNPRCFPQKPRITLDSSEPSLKNCPIPPPRAYLGRVHIHSIQLLGKTGNGANQPDESGNKRYEPDPKQCQWTPQRKCGDIFFPEDSYTFRWQS